MLKYQQSNTMHYRSQKLSFFRTSTARMATRSLLTAGSMLSLLSSFSSSAQATTLIRMSIEELTNNNATVILGDVLSVESYWNSTHTFIFSDVRIAIAETIKGRTPQDELVITLMGGTVEDVTTLIVGGPELAPGKTYLLFLGSNILPGNTTVQTVRDHIQGVFDVIQTREGWRAISQANRHPLLADKQGATIPPGGSTGVPLDDIVRSIQTTANQDK